ncbi:MAG: hypothetical protein N2202_05300 [Proteobacteria bacterium]|nr:hypothetical protein [Pseudomonadota bacterium]
MYLIFEESGCFFGISVNDIFKIIDLGSLIFRDDKYFFYDMEIRKTLISDIFDLKNRIDQEAKKVVILEHFDSFKPALFVHDVVGFIKEDGKILKKQDFLNLYGYKHVKGFLINNNRLITLIDKKAFLNFGNNGERE